jgi:hypothetical protein
VFLTRTPQVNLDALFFSTVPQYTPLFKFLQWHRFGRYFLDFLEHISVQNCIDTLPNKTISLNNKKFHSEIFKTGCRVTPPPMANRWRVATTDNFHIRIKKNAINRSSARPRPTYSLDTETQNPFFWTLSFSTGCSRSFSRPWSVSRRKRLTLDDMGPNMGPPFGQKMAEKRLEIKIYMG